MTRLLWTGGLALSAAGLLLTLLLWWADAGEGTVYGVACGSVLFIINMVLDTLFLIKSLKNDADSFVKRFFRGKLVRIVIVLMIFFTIWVFIALNRFIFVVTFFILYFLIYTIYSFFPSILVIHLPISNILRRY